MRVRKRRRQEAEYDRAQRAELEEQMPGLYRHPEPSSTNPHWEAEINAGPIPSRTRKKNAEKPARASSTRSNIASSVSIAPSLSMERSDSALSGMGPYQRNDEMLWGSRASDLPRLRPNQAGSSRDALPARLPRAALRDRARTSQNPPINDLHPPTTRKIESKEEVMWMLQPPPVPEIMNGTAFRTSRPNSTASRPSVSTKGKTSSRPGSQRTPGSPEINPLDTRPASASKYLEVPTRLVRSRTLPLRHNASELPEAGLHTTIRKPPPTLQLSQMTAATKQTMHRPPLSTIRSEDADDIENTMPHRSYSLGLRPGQHAQRAGINDPAADARTHASPSTRKQNGSLLVEKRILATHDFTDEHSPEQLDALECWTNPDFELPQWIHEHTKREVRTRWSFDI